MIDQLITIIKYIYYFLILKLTQLAQWIGQPSGKKIGKFSQKLVIFGDDFALGYGDKISFGAGIGLSFYFKQVLAKKSNSKQNWSFFNYGVYGSTSLDWLIDGKCFKRYILNKKIEGAKIFIYSVGMYDIRNYIEPTKSIQNILQTCGSLSEFGKVYIYSVPDLTREADLQDRILEFNKLLKKAIKDLNNQNISILLEIDSSNYEYRRSDIILSSGTHFNNKGYFKIAKDSMDILINDIVKVEFQAFSKELGY